MHRDSQVKFYLIKDNKVLSYKKYTTITTRNGTSVMYYNNIVSKEMGRKRTEKKRNFLAHTNKPAHAINQTRYGKETERERE